ncbi:uncharacterized protein [Argopecten irradians]|uniref:uncharacterized protein n=1 Tax=Argopecten irradians TaxID=31199 RepID=UPI0037131EED
MGGVCGKINQKRQMKIMLLGLDGGGKTTILYQLKLGQVVTTIPTIGMNVETVEYNKVDLEISDVGKGGGMRPGADAVVFVVDSTDKERIEESRKLLRNIVKQFPREEVVAIVANKQDVSGAMIPEAIAEIMFMEFIYTRHECQAFGISATTGEGLYKVLDWVVNTVSAKSKYVRL